MQAGRVVPAAHTLAELAELAEDGRTSFDRLCDDAVGEVFAAAPALAEDVEVRAQLLAAAPAQLSELLDLLADPSLPADGDPPAELLAVVAPLARRGMEPGDLTRACRIGQHALWRSLIEHAAERGASAKLLELASSRLAARTDAVVDGLMRAWVAERELWVTRRVARRGTLVQRLLAGEEQDVAAASSALDWDLDRHVCAAVLWHEEAATADDAPDALEEVAIALAAAAGGPAFTVPADDGSLWAWAASAVAPDLAAVAEAAGAAAQDGRRVALGTPGEGIAGFRVGHVEAQLARRVAELSGRPTVVVRYDEVEPVSLMADDPERLARFVRRTLGPLAAENEATARLRRTLRVWLAAGGSAPAAAARLGVHKNTVLYRVHRAGALLPRPVDADRLALELALAAADEVGLGRLSAQ